MLKKHDPMSDVTEIACIAVPESLLTEPERFGGRSKGGCRTGGLQLRDRTVVGMSDSEDAPRYIVMPKLTEPHVHLDKCHTVERLGSIGGDLTTASVAQQEDKARWDADDLRARMRRGIRELVEAGCGAARTHIDWDGVGSVPLAWEVACDIRGEAREMGLELQVAALTGIDQMADMDFAGKVAKRVAEDGGVLGSFILHHRARDEGLKSICTLADHYGLSIDFHVDEGLDHELSGLAEIIKIVRETGFEGPVLCGHACSLAMKSEQYVLKIAENVAESGIAIVSLPTTNLYLQGRRKGTPKSRGITMIHELQKAGAKVSLGSDNVRDAFCPVGAHDPLNSLSLAVLTAHLDPPIGDHLPMVSDNARSALGLPTLSVDGSKIEDLILFEAPDLTTLLSSRQRPKALTAFVQGDLDHG